MDYETADRLVLEQYRKIRNAKRAMSSIVVEYLEDEIRRVFPQVVKYSIECDASEPEFGTVFYLGNLYNAEGDIVTQDEEWRDKVNEIVSYYESDEDSLIGSFEVEL